MTVAQVATAIINAISAGFGIVADFASMIKNAFTGLFIDSGNLSTFAVVALVMIGVSIVTGLGMLIFRRFFSRT